MRFWALIAVVVAVFAAIVASVLYPVLSRPPLSIPPWALSFGNPDASVTVIEFYDLHCPYCAMAHAQLDPLYRQLIAEGKLRLVFIDLIVHPDALVAHQYLHCAYRQLGDRTYDLLTELYRVYLEDPENGPAKQLQLLQQYKCADAPTKSDFDNGVRALSNALGISIRGTPTFVIIKNGAVNVVVGADVAKVVSLISQ
jgi:Protein-disulfide isomerase